MSLLMRQQGALPMSNTPNIDAARAINAGAGILADAFYLDLVLELGEAPGQFEAFDLLLEQLDDSMPSSAWYAGMLGFGLGLAEDAEARAFVECAASAFLMIATPGDFPAGGSDA